MILGLIGLLYVLMTQAKSRLVYAALVLSIIASMVVTPLLESQQAAAFFEKQTARQAEFDQHLKEQTAAREAQDQLTTSSWDPQRNPLDNAPRTQPASAAPGAQPGISARRHAAHPSTSNLRYCGDKLHRCGTDD